MRVPPDSTVLKIDRQLDGRVRLEVRAGGALTPSVVTLSPQACEALVTILRAAADPAAEVFRLSLTV